MDFTVQSSLPVESAKQAVRKLLRDRYVSFDETDGTIRSTYIPVPLFGWRRALYSRDNWVGTNPFISVSYVAITCSPRPHGGSEVAVAVSAGRSKLLYLFLAASIAPALLVQPIAGIIVAALLGLKALFTFRITIARLLPAEIRKAVAAIQ